MFDIAPSEFLLVAFVALVVIGPKDLPKAMRVVGYWVGKARGVARQFRSGFDSMVREAELEEMEKRWASENERIMREHPQTETGTAAAASADTAHAVHSPETDEHTDRHDGDHTAEPVMVEKPVVIAASAAASSSPVPSVSVEPASAPVADQDSFADRDPAADRSADPSDTVSTTPAVSGVRTDDKTGKSDVAPS